MSRPELDDLTGDQEAALEAIAKWHANGGQSPLTLGGLAGTGKTTLVSLLGDVLPRARIAYAAYTGKAVSVLAGKLAGAGQVTTLHRLLYQPSGQVLCAASGEPLPDGAARCCVHAGLPEGEPCPVRHSVSFTPKPDPLAGLDLVVADEASMIPGPLWADLTGHGVPVLAVGDHGQLPPVRSSFSLMARPDLILEQICRQHAASPIHAVAQWARGRGHIPPGAYGPGVIKIRPADLGRPGMGLHPAEADLIICATNPTRTWHNNAMRAWHGRSGPPREGDRVICLRNNRDQGLFNGQLGTVLDAAGPVIAGGEKAWRMTIAVEDLDLPWSGAVAAAPFGERKPDLPRDRDLAVFDFGYAITAHKCTDDTTLILTRSGWKAHADLTVGEQVLTLNPGTQLSEWQPVLDIHRYHVDGEQLLSIEDESHSSLTTLNHRWPVKDYRGRITFVTSQYLYGGTGSYRAIAKAAPHRGFPEFPKYSDAFVELVAWFWTEGDIHSNRGKPLDAVRIRQSETANPEEVLSIRAALLAEFGPARNRLGRWRDPSPGWAESWRHPGGLHKDDPGYRYWQFSLNNAAGRLLQDCAPGRVVTPEFILALTRSQLALFISISLRGDGYTEYAGASAYSVIRQKDRVALEAFQFACTLAGFSTVIRQTPSSGLWWMRVKTGRFHHPRKTNGQLVRYTGTVWCPETANGTWFAKRNETTYFTGNSQGSEASRVLVIEEGWPPPGDDFRARWLYTAVTRAKDELTVAGW